jgi:uncharacterized protein DUF5658
MSVSPLVVGLSLSVVFAAGPCFAQDAVSAVEELGPAADLNALPSIPMVAFPEFPGIAAAAPGFAPRSKPSITLVSLGLSFAAFQALDAHSTLSAAASGNGRELNPIVSGLLQRPAALVAFKGATTAGIVYLSHELAKRNRTAAILMMVGMNSAYGLVAWHNYSIARGR